MVLRIELDNSDSEILRHLVMALDEPGLTADQCAKTLLSGVLSRIWEGLFEDDQTMS